MPRITSAALVLALALTPMTACTFLDPLSDVSSGGPPDASSAGPCVGLAGPVMIDIGGYCVDATEVTIAQYSAFVAVANPASQTLATCAWNASFTPNAPPPGPSDNPVVYVDWCDAYAFCAWAGKRLCGRIGGGTVATDSQAVASADQWFAACSHSGLHAYPYGDTYVPSACNGADYGAGVALSVGTARACEGGFPGLHDLSGNVGEWEDSCASDAGANDQCSVRGGSFYDPSARQACDALHNEVRNYSDFKLGFRCCRDH
jgi:formylglycine-generating enzyme required for sulfatase activity